MIGPIRLVGDPAAATGNMAGTRAELLDRADAAVVGGEVATAAQLVWWT